MANANFHCELNAWADGSTIKAYMRYYRNDGYGYTYIDTAFPSPTMTIAETNYTDSSFRDSVRAGVYVGDVRTTQFSKTVSSNGTYTVSFTAGAGTRNDFQGTWSTSVTVTDAATGPSGASLSDVLIKEDYVQATMDLNSWGTSSTNKKIRLCVLQDAPITTGGLPQYCDEYDSVPVEALVNNSSMKVNNPSFEIIPNSEYYLGVYASTSVGETRYSYGKIVTMPRHPGIQKIETSGSSATVYIHVNSDGGKYDKTVAYSIDNGTIITTSITATGTNSITDNFTISNLSQGDHTISVWTYTSAGASNYTVQTFHIGLTVNRFYSSSNNLATQTIKFYGSVSGAKTKIMKLYGSKNGRAALVGVYNQKKIGQS